MPKNKRDILFATKISQPVPGEDALDSNDDVFAVWRNSFEEDIGISLDVSVQKNFTLLIEDTKIHRFGMQIDATVKFVLLGVKSHKGLLVRKYFGFLNHT